MKKPLPEFLHGIELFNQARFFDAHEVLEDVWRAAPVEEKKFQQGLIQVAVALYHHGNGNSVGARSVLRRSFRNLSRYPEGFGGVRLAMLLKPYRSGKEPWMKTSRCLRCRRYFFTKAVLRSSSVFVSVFSLRSSVVGLQSSVSVVGLRFVAGDSCMLWPETDD